MEDLKDMPFSTLTDTEIALLFKTPKWQWDDVIGDNLLKDYMCKLYSDDLFLSLECSYMTPEHFNHTFANKAMSIELSMFHINIQCLNAKHRVLCQLLELLCVNFDVIVLTEIWSYNIEFYKNILPGYTFYFELSHVGKSGGVGMYIRNCFNQNVTSKYKLTNTNCYAVEDLWIEISKNKMKYIIGGIYRHPNQSVPDFQTMLEPTLNKLSHQKHTCFIAGDMNIDLLKCETHKSTQDYLDMIAVNNFRPLLILPTRITSKSNTLIDHIYYLEGKSNRNMKIKSGNLVTDVSDHLPNYVLLFSDKPTFKKERPLVRIFSKQAREQFFNKLSTCDWNEIYTATDANVACNIFQNKLLVFFNDCFKKVRLSRKRARDKKWITDTLKKASRTKAKLYKNWITCKTKDAEAKYKSYKAVFKKVSLECEMAYYKDLFDKKNNTIRQIWKNLNTVCSFKAKNTKKFISKIRINNIEISDSLEMSKAFNQYFSSVGATLLKQNVQITQSIDDYNYQKYCSNPVTSSMFCEPVLADELISVIFKLKSKKSAGPDNIGPDLLKEVTPAILYPYLHIINLSFSTGVVPDTLKIARVIPVFKKGDESLLQNYRPISLLSVFHKVLEKLMAERVIRFINANSVLYDYQFGFRKNYSTVLSLIDVVDDIYCHLDKQEFAMGIYLDLQKAFDTVDHTILLWKLKNCGIRGIVHDWFTSYLHNRNQFTSVNGHDSTSLPVTCGVPQGSVLGPLLFLIFINDIPSSVPGGKIKIFADDTNLFLTSKTLPDLEEKGNVLILNINKWLIANKLHLNIDKTCYSIFSPNRLPASGIKIKINNNELKQVNSCKYLGVTIDEELKWIPHIEDVLQKLKRLVGICYKIRYKLPDYCLRNIYFAFVYPHILYGLEIYGNTYVSYLDKLTKLNNKLLRILQKKERNCCNECLYVQYNTLPPIQLFNYQVLTLVHKMLFSPYLLPSIFCDYFTPTNTVHDYYTRHNKLHLSQTNTRFGHRSLKFKGSQLWNRLPLNLIKITSHNSFKKNVRNFLIGEPL